MSSIHANVPHQLLTPLAKKYPDIKFATGRADLLVENYPERNTPTILIYKDTNIAKQVVTLASLNGVRTNLQNLELLLVEVGAIKEGDVRLKNRDEDGEEEGARRNNIKSGTSSRKYGADESDDDWD